MQALLLALEYMASDSKLLNIFVYDVNLLFFYQSLLLFLQKILIIAVSAN